MNTQLTVTWMSRAAFNREGFDGSWFFGYVLTRDWSYVCILGLEVSVIRGPK